MKIEIIYKNNRVVVENNFKYNSYIDVRHFVMDTIKTSIESLKQ